MPLTPELRARMAKDMQQNRKFDGDTDIPAQCRAFAGLADMETVERPAVCGFTLERGQKVFFLPNELVLALTYVF